MIANVPASIRSGMVLYVPPDNFCTPSIVITGVPAPEILAPHELRKSAKATISGSIAALIICDVPGIKLASIIIDSVPVTLILEKTTVPACKSLPSKLYPSARLVTLMPNFLYPSIKKSIGRLPITQPPG